MKRIAFILLLASLAYSQGTFVGAGKGVGAGTIPVVTGAAPALVQSWPASPATCAGVNTCTKTSAGNVTTGDEVIGFTSYNSTSATITSVTICGVSATLRNSAIVAVSSTAAVYVARATSTGTCPVVFNYSTTVTSAVGGVDISNPNATTPIDCSAIQNQGAGFSGGGTTPDAITSGPCTTTANGDLIVGITFDTSFNAITYAAGTGESFTGMPAFSDWWQGETKTQATAGSVASTFTCVTNCFGNPTTASVAVKHQ